MKIAVMTWFHYRNLGTALQVAALTNYLQSHGHQVEVVNYIPGEYRERPIQKKTVAQRFEVTRRRLKKMMGKNNSVPAVFTDADRDKVFEDFLNQHIKLTKRVRILPELEQLNVQFDAFICGSDQIWSPLCFDAHYFLDFVTDTNKMVAYAPSVGLTKVEDKYIAKNMQALTKRFAHLSVREQSGADIISAMTNKTVRTVLDPTMLVERSSWDVVANSAKHVPEGKYILVYFLGANEVHWQKVSAISQKLGMEVKCVPVFQKDSMRPECIKTPVGPAEFLALIRNASYVCTDSFHATVFSILFEKKFSTFERFGANDKRNQNSRIYNILHLLNLQKRIYREEAENLMEDIDYPAVLKKLKLERQASQDYLQSALEGVQKHLRDDLPTKKHIYKYNSLCCGCGACATACPTGAIAVSMNVQGFYTAMVDNEKCISCGACRRVCPLQNENDGKCMQHGKLYAYKDLDAEVLASSSSGGFAYRMANLLLGKGYSVAGCYFDRESQKARYTLIAPDEKEKLHMLQGSKYMQSTFFEIIPALKACTTPIAVFGTPCQLSGAKLALQERKDVLYIDLFCHGVPSYRAYEKYQRHLQRKNNLSMERAEVSFRHKAMGWHNKYIRVSDGRRSVCQEAKKDLYFRFFESCQGYSPVCYECGWRTHSCADIRIGDYWGTKYAMDDTGVSMVMVNTANGAEIIKELNLPLYGEIHEENIQDCEVQQMFNFQKPLAYEDHMNALANKAVPLASVVKRYIEPYEYRAIPKWEVKVRTYIKKILQ